MIKCSEIYNPDLIFATDNRSPIISLCNILHSEGNPYEAWVNEELYSMFTHDTESSSDGMSQGDNLSIDYLLNRQDKYFSPLFERMLNYYGVDYQRLATRISVIIITKYLKGWSKLADAWFADYNPVNNYDMAEHETNGGTNKQSTDLTETTSSSETITNKYNGFNANESTEVSSSDSDSSGSKTTTGTALSNVNSIDNTRDLTRSGNIGVTTSQQMIESEYNLRKKNLLDIIYNDIDKILFLDIY